MSLPTTLAPNLREFFFKLFRQLEKAYFSFIFRYVGPLGLVQLTLTFKFYMDITHTCAAATNKDPDPTNGSTTKDVSDTQA